MRIHVINGPNLNLLGTREVSIYGDLSLEQYTAVLEASFPAHTLTFLQSNLEGELIQWIQEARGRMDGLVINPGGYAHTSVAIADALALLEEPKIEVHISHLYQRETYRQQMITATQCSGVISGLGLMGYKLAIQAIEALHQGEDGDKVHE